MPMDKTRYPPDWDAISKRIRFERAKGCCEQCGAKNGTRILRHKLDPARFVFLHDTLEDYWIDEKGKRVPVIRVSEYQSNSVVVILTVHHIGIPYPDGRQGDPHDKMDVRDENLIALCQRCHLLADLPMHIEKAKETRAKKKRERIADLGQLSLFEV